jgi:hypothetical protein
LRVKAIGDIINGARTIKSYGWEKPYEKIVSKWRGKQFRQLNKTMMMGNLNSGFF